MKIAFIITKTPQEEGFNNFIKLLNLYVDNQDIHVYLIGNGVYNAVHGHIHTDLIHGLAQKNTVLAYEKDLKARGLEEMSLIPGVSIFPDYGDMVVDIMEKMDQVFNF